MRLYLRVATRMYEIEAPGGRVGSAPELEVSLPDPGVQPVHAGFSWDGQRWWIEQLSDRAIYVDGSPVPEERAALPPNGSVQLGEVMAEFWQEGAAPPSTRREIELSKLGTLRVEPASRQPAFALAQGDAQATLMQRPVVQDVDPSRTLMQAPGALPAALSPAPPGLGEMRTMIRLPDKTLLKGQPPVAGVIEHVRSTAVIPKRAVFPAPAPPVPPAPAPQPLAAAAQLREVTPRDWTVWIQLAILFGGLSVICLITFLIGMHWVPALPG